MSHRRRAAAKNVVLGLVALVALGGAAFLFTRSRHGDVPSGEYLDFRCTKCSQTFKLSYRELDEIMERREIQVVDGRLKFFKCRKCGEFAAERADEAAPAK
jgi:DNA-directed RNA polymerase subunit RPC12/RpoP